MVAVATKQAGFTDFVGLLPAFAFHAVSSVVGLQLLRAAQRRSEPQLVAAPAEAE